MTETAHKPAVDRTGMLTREQFAKACGLSQRTVRFLNDASRKHGGIKRNEPGIAPGKALIACDQIPLGCVVFLLRRWGIKLDLICAMLAEGQMSDSGTWTISDKAGVCISVEINAAARFIAGQSKLERAAPTTTSKEPA